MSDRLAKQVVSIAAKMHTSVDDLVDDVILVTRGNTVLGHASPNKIKQTEALYMPGAHESVASADAAALP